MKAKINILIITVGLLIGGISYWFQPYNHLMLLGTRLNLIWSIGAFLGAFLLILFLNKKPSHVSLFLTLGVTLAILARIIYDTTFWDSTSHNLAPFEIIICGFITIPCAFLGSFFALFIKKMLK